jgi:hypothetical protein
VPEEPACLVATLRDQRALAAQSGPDQLL